ncbi:MAG: ATP-binding cassette domain-containing protein [Rhodospirillaceae bacterium]
MAAVLDISAARVVKEGGGQRFELHVPQFQAGAGDRIALVGPSGCGKSTLLDLLALLSLPEAVKRFRFDPAPETGEDLAPLFRAGDLSALAALRKRHMGYVLQTGGLLPYLTIAGNIGLPRRLLGLGDDGSVERLAAVLGISGHLGKFPAALSVGERQRAAIARALAHRPAVVLADEPTAALDPENSDLVMGMLVELAEEFGTTVIVVSHDRERVARFGFTTAQHHILEREAAGCVRSAFWT